MGALKAKVNGDWVPLEYSGAANPQNALGIVAMGSYIVVSSIPTGTTTLTNPINFTSVVGRRYRLCYQIRVVGVTTGNGINLKWTGSGVEVGGTDLWHTVSPGPYSYISGSVMFDGTGVASAYTMTAYVPAATGLWLEPATASYFYLEDIGPNAAPALPLPPTPQAWTVATLASPWETNMTAPAYRKIGDIVYLRGDARTGAIGSPMFTLPVGFRPPTGLIFSVDSSNLHGRVDVFTNGVVYAQVGGASWTSVNNIQFSVTP